MSDNANTPAPAAPAESSQEGGGDEGQESQTQERPSSKAKAPAYRKFKIGEEEVTLSDDDIRRDYSKWRGADQKFREAAQAKQSVEQFMRNLEEDPEAILSDKRLPIDRKKLAEKWLVEQIEAELKPKDPRDAKLSEAERRLKAYEDREAEEKKSAEQKTYEAAKEQRKTAIADTLGKAMQQTQLSAHPESAAAVLREMALYMRAAKERGEDVTPDELVEHVHNSRFQQLYTLAHQFEGEELVEFLGEEIVNRIRKADLARLRAGREQGQSHRTESPFTSGNERKSPPRMDAHSAKLHARKLLFGK